MKKTGVIILSVLMLIGLFPHTFKFVFFKLNQISIVQTFCIQKDKKENTCQGKCYLKKILTEEEPGNPAPTPEESELTHVQLYCIYTSKVDLNISLKKNKRKPILFNKHIIPNNKVDRLLRPPEQV